jgi:hypothetical protein
MVTGELQEIKWFVFDGLRSMVTGLANCVSVGVAHCVNQDLAICICDDVCNDVFENFFVSHLSSAAA